MLPERSTIVLQISSVFRRRLLINSGTINGNVQLGGAKDVVQLFTGGKINGNLTLSGTQSSTLILDGDGHAYSPQCQHRTDNWQIIWH